MNGSAAVLRRRSATCTTGASQRVPFLHIRPSGCSAVRKTSASRDCTPLRTWEDARRWLRTSITERWMRARRAGARAGRSCASGGPPCRDTCARRRPPAAPRTCCRRRGSAPAPALIDSETRTPGRGSNGCARDRVLQFGDPPRLVLRAAVPQHDDELVAGEARAQVVLADRRAQHGADRAQRAIAGLVAVGVVDFLQAIEVEHDDAAALPFACAARARARLRTADRASAGSAGRSADRCATRAAVCSKRVEL